MANGMFDSTRFFQSFENLMLTTASAVQGKHPRVAFFGECVDLLRKQGNAEAAIQAEKLGNQLAARYAMDILCGYSMGVQADMEERSHPENLRRAFGRLS